MEFWSSAKYRRIFQSFDQNIIPPSVSILQIFAFIHIKNIENKEKSDFTVLFLSRFVRSLIEHWKLIEPFKLIINDRGCWTRAVFIMGLVMSTHIMWRSTFNMTMRSSTQNDNGSKLWSVYTINDSQSISSRRGYWKRRVRKIISRGPG